MDKLNIKTRIKLWIAGIALNVYAWSMGVQRESLMLIGRDNNNVKPIDRGFKTIDGITPIKGDFVFYTKIGLSKLWDPLCKTLQHDHVMSRKEYYVFASRENCENWITGRNKRILEKLKESEIFKDATELEFWEEFKSLHPDWSKSQLVRLFWAKYPMFDPRNKQQNEQN